MTNLQNAFVLASTTITATGSSPQFPVGSLEKIFIDVNVSAISGANASITFSYSRIGLDGLPYQMWQGGLSATGQLSIDIGPGLSVPKDPGATGLLTWTVTGTTPSVTFSANVRGK